MAANVQLTPKSIIWLAISDYLNNNQYVDLDDLANHINDNLKMFCIETKSKINCETFTFEDYETT